LSVFVVAFYIWSLRILYQQKHAWSVFAKKKGYEYTRGGLTDPPFISGEVDDISLSFYTGQKPTDDVRGQRYITVLEFQMDTKMPTGAVVSTEDFRDIMAELSFNQPLKIKSDLWKKKKVIMRARNASLLEDYLTEERQKALFKIMSMEGFSVLFIFDEVEAVLRIETADPLIKPSQIDKYAKQMVHVLKILDLSDEENERYKPILQKNDVVLPARSDVKNTEDNVQVNEASEEADLDVTIEDKPDAEKPDTKKEDKKTS